MIPKENIYKWLQILKFLNTTKTDELQMRASSMPPDNTEIALMAPILNSKHAVYSISIILLPSSCLLFADITNASSSQGLWLQVSHTQKVKASTRVPTLHQTLYIIYHSSFTWRGTDTHFTGDQNES